MTTPAYPEIYLENAMSAMGEAFDYAVNDCDIKGGDFIKLFVGSPVCRRMENGEPAYLAGKSGAEIVCDCVMSVSGKVLNAEPTPRYERSPEYWAGWAVAYYQWRSCRKYSEIFKAISFEDILFMYPTLHEADLTKFEEIAEQRLRTVFPDTKLRRLRTVCGFSQSELSKLSGVSLRSIQMYEQRQKDINKAGVLTVLHLARSLGCTIEDLVEN